MVRFNQNKQLRYINFATASMIKSSEDHYTIFCNKNKNKNSNSNSNRKKRKEKKEESRGKRRKAEEGQFLFF